MAHQKHFYIESQLDTSMVLTPLGFSKNPNTELVIEKKLPASDPRVEMQYWILDEENMIRSYYRNGEVYFAPTDMGKGQPIQSQEYHGTKAQTFELKNSEIKDAAGLVMDVKDGFIKPGNSVITWEPHGGPNQLWNFEYVL